jgi:hypothetical protein
MMNHVLLHSFSQILDLLFLFGCAGGCIAASRLPFSIAAPLTGA